MKVSESIQNSINGQINKELFSAYTYLSMSAHLEELNLEGFAHWMRKQANEELQHAMKLYNFLIERDGTVVLESINKPTNKWPSVLSLAQNAYEHEQNVTRSINSLKEQADKENDHATASFLKWFIDEQVEEEDNSRRLMEKLKLIGEDKGALLMLDAELKKRE